MMTEWIAALITLFLIATNWISWNLSVSVHWLLAVEARKADWRNAFLNGHEIGNHTVRHPCRGASHAHNLETYTPKLIREEIRDAYTWLNHHIGEDNDSGPLHIPVVILRLATHRMRTRFFQLLAPITLPPG